MCHMVCASCVFSNVQSTSMESMVTEANVKSSRQWMCVSEWFVIIWFDMMKWCVKSMAWATCLRAMCSRARDQWKNWRRDHFAKTRCGCAAGWVEPPSKSADEGEGVKETACRRTDSADMCSELPDSANFLLDAWAFSMSAVFMSNEMAIDAQNGRRSVCMIISATPARVSEQFGR